MGVCVQATLINIAKTHAIFGEGTRVKVIKVRFGLFIHVFMSLCSLAAGVEWTLGRATPQHVYACYGVGNAI